MLDNVTYLWILRAKTSTFLFGVFIFRESENSKEDSKGSFFIQFSLLKLKKYKTYLRRTLLTSEEGKVNLFSYLVREAQKRLNYHLSNGPSKVAYSLSFMSVKEGKITQKHPFDYEEWGLQQ